MLLGVDFEVFKGHAKPGVSVSPPFHLIRI